MRGAKVIMFALGMAGLLAMGAGGPVAAQSGAASTRDSTSQHHRMLQQMMKDMTTEMAGMTEAMSKGDLNPQIRSQMADRMRRMSGLMRRMSGLASRPAMSEPEAEKQMEQMRKSMDRMMRDPVMAPR